MNILEVVSQRRQLESLEAMPAAQLDSLLPLLRRSDVLTQPDRGYEDRQYLGGIVLEAEQRDGERLLFIAAHGGELSNDHYPNYQILFRQTNDDTYELLSSSTYFTDVAGVEGLEWPQLWALYFIPGLPLACLTTLAWWILNRRRDHRVTRLGQAH
jgi:hypothetical protein